MKLAAVIFCLLGLLFSGCAAVAMHRALVANYRSRRP